jgi:hypothetical protein
VLDLTRVALERTQGLYLTFLRFYLLNRRSFTYLISIRVLKFLFRTSLVLGLYIHVYSLQRTHFLIIVFVACFNKTSQGEDFFIFPFDLQIDSIC